MQEGDTGVIFQGLLLHQSGNDNRLAISNPHGRIRLSYAQEGKGGLSIWSRFFSCLIGDTGVDVHNDRAILSNLGGHIQEDANINGHRLNDLGYRRLGSHSSGNEEDILISDPDNGLLVIEGGDRRTGQNLYISLFCNRLHNI